jgi:hypothetical protein
MSRNGNRKTKFSDVKLFVDEMVIAEYSLAQRVRDCKMTVRQLLRQMALRT